MKKLIAALFILFIKIALMSQSVISVPGEYYQIFKAYPKSNEKISFTLPNPLSDYKDYVFDKKNTYQYLISVPIVSDSLLSECINYAMLSLSFERKIKNMKKGTEIWWGHLSNKLNEDPTVTGIYFKNFSDSTRVFVLTTFSLDYIEKKKKTNTSKYICETIKFILDKYRDKK